MQCACFPHGRTPQSWVLTTVKNGRKEAKKEFPVESLSKALKVHKSQKYLHVKKHFFFYEKLGHSDKLNLDFPDVRVGGGVGGETAAEQQRHCRRGAKRRRNCYGS